MALDLLLHYFHYDLQLWRLLNLIKKNYFGVKPSLQRSPPKILMFAYVYLSGLSSYMESYMELSEKLKEK